MKTRTQQIEELQKEWTQPRWEGITRPYSAEDVVKLRGSVNPECTLAQLGAAKMWRLLHGESKKGYINSLGALTGGQALQQAKAGIEAVYLSGWQVAADANLAASMYPDQSLYPANSVPAVVERINNTFRRADQIDLLFTRYNGSLEFVGVCGLLKKLQHQNLLYPDKLIRARLTKDALPEYIEIFFSSPSARNAMMNCVKTTSGQKGISGKDIKSQVVLLPPVKEQAEIVRRVEQLFAYADTIEKQVNNALARVNNLTQSILAKAFRGELTAQWRAENPDLISGENSAAALLEKIKAERAASGGKKASRKKS